MKKRCGMTEADSQRVKRRKKVQSKREADESDRAEETEGKTEEREEEKLADRFGVLEENMEYMIREIQRVKGKVDWVIEELLEVHARMDEEYATKSETDGDETDEADWGKELGELGAEQIEEGQKGTE